MCSVVTVQVESFLKIFLQADEQFWFVTLKEEDAEISDSPAHLVFSVI